jgi:nitrous oxidase accessory protein
MSCSHTGLFAFLVILLSLLTPVLSDAKIIEVKKTGEKAISEAIVAALEGDTIKVYRGLYKEGNIIITKSLCILGIDYPVLDGEFKHEIFTIAAPNVTINGFKIINTGRSSMEDKAAIKCMDADNVNISYNIFYHTFFGIHISNSVGISIECNTLLTQGEHEYEHGNGIHLWKCKDAYIQGNEIEGHRDGIYFEFVTNSKIINNISRKNIRYGLHFMFSHNDEYYHNSFINNGAGVAVMYTTNVTMRYNKFDQNWGSSSYGLLLKDIRDSQVEFNVFSSNTSGIYMEGTSRTIFLMNEFSENGYAIKLMASCDDNTFRKNNFIGNTFDISTNGNTVLNILDQNYWDKYQGYDRDRNSFGDVPYRPVSLFSMIVEQVPPAVILWRSFLVLVLDRAEKSLPAVTPENLKDESPKMKAHDLHS